MPLKLLIVDDMDSMRILVKQYLRRIENVVVVGEASEADEAFEKAIASQPDIILMDISLSGASGIDVARKIKAVNPAVRLYFFTAYEVEELRKMVISSPADGFISKSRLKQELLEMIEREIENNKSTK